MFLNYLKIALRQMMRQKVYSTISIGGLAAGSACAILIFLWARDEWSYDRFHPNVESIYRANWDVKAPDGMEGIGPGTPPPLAATMIDHIPEVAAVTRLRQMPGATVRSGDVFFNEEGILSADSNFFSFFGFTLLSGDPTTVLRLPNSVVLTQDVAARIFGSELPIGKTILIDDERKNMYGTYHNLFRVTGVMENPPHNSHIQFSMLTSMSSYPEVSWRNWSWVWMQMATYVRLRDGVAPALVDAKIPELVRQFGAGAFRRLGTSYEELTKDGGRYTFTLQPLTDVYLGSTLIGNRLGPLGDRSQVTLLSIIAGLILGIACINFMNLATARAASRVKEVGVRKAMGSHRRLLFGQFIVESTLYSLLSLPIAILLIESFLGAFNELSGKAIDFNLMNPTWMPAVLLLLVIAVGFISGTYPGLYLSSLRPALTVRGTNAPSAGGTRLRNGLVALQFSATIALIACTLLVQQQMEYIRNADLGFDRRNVVVVSNKNGRLGAQAEAFRDALMDQSQILGVSLSTGIPPSSAFQDGYKVEGGSDQTVGLISYMADERFMSAMGIGIIQGRGFSRDFAESSSVILNEAAVKAFGITEPVGKTILYPGGNNTTFRIVGVMRDFHFRSLYAPITPFAVFHLSSKSYMSQDSYVVIRIRPTDVAASVRSIEQAWKSFAPSMPFEYSFLDDTIASAYRSAERLGKVFILFSLLTIVIACVGLFGLAAYSTERRTKEVGIRKVLGATDAAVVKLLTREFLLLVLIANVIAWPAAWYIMHTWLQDFAYRIDISPAAFLMAGALAFGVALLTVSTQAIRAAIKNPVDSLRYE